VDLLAGVFLCGLHGHHDVRLLHRSQQRMEWLTYLSENARLSFFECFPGVCPEPVLAK
jgi:hypothetical protein